MPEGKLPYNDRYTGGFLASSHAHIMTLSSPQETEKEKKLKEKKEKKTFAGFFFLLFCSRVRNREQERFFLIKFNVFLAFAVNFNLTHLACWFSHQHQWQRHFEGPDVVNFFFRLLS